jgi:hypothetical protein
MISTSTISFIAHSLDLRWLSHRAGSRQYDDAEGRPRTALLIALFVAHLELGILHLVRSLMVLVVLGDTGV